MPEFRVIDAALVRQLLPYHICIDLMRDAFRAEAEGRTVQPIRQAMTEPAGRGLVSVMPGYIRDPDVLGIKVMSVFPGNFGTALGSHQGPILMFDPQNGSLAAMIDGREVTAIRTAAATAVATDILARADATSLGIYGYGEQAHSHLAAIRAVRSIDEVLVWGRDGSRARDFAAQAGPNARAVRTPREAASADILCLTTAAREPYFEGAWLRPGQHLNVVGSSIPATSEIDSETLSRARLFVDYEPSARALGGDIRRALDAGAIAEDHILGSVGAAITGRVPGRTTPGDITLFKSLGMAAEDLIAADHIVRAAMSTGRGQVVSF